MIATGAALAPPEIAGLILHAPLAGTYQDLARYQWLELGLSLICARSRIAITMGI